MSPTNIVRAWKDPEYRSSLSEKDLALLPDHPSGVIDLSNDQLDAITGGRGSCSCNCCRCTCVVVQ